MEQELDLFLPQIKLRSVGRSNTEDFIQHKENCHNREIEKGKLLLKEHFLLPKVFNYR